MTRLEDFRRYLRLIGFSKDVSDAEATQALNSLPVNQVEVPPAPRLYTFARAMRVYFSPRGKGRS